MHSMHCPVAPSSLSPLAGLPASVSFANKAEACREKPGAGAERPDHCGWALLLKAYYRVKHLVQQLEARGVAIPAASALLAVPLPVLSFRNRDATTVLATFLSLR